MKNAMHWCKIHHEARTDPKLKILTLAERGVWSNLLLFASEQQQRGTFPADDRYVLALECAEGDEETLNSTIDKLARVRHIITDDDGLHFSFRTWDARQYDKPSDQPEAVKERVRQYRERAASGPETPPPHMNGSVKRDVTPSNAMSRDVTHGNALEVEVDRDLERSISRDDLSEVTGGMGGAVGAIAPDDANLPSVDEILEAAGLSKSATRSVKAMRDRYYARAPCPDILDQIDEMHRYIADPIRNKKHRTMSTAFMRNWLIIAETESRHATIRQFPKSQATGAGKTGASQGINPRILAKDPEPSPAGTEEWHAWYERTHPSRSAVS